jgi:chromosome segregation ATPase
LFAAEGAQPAAAAEMSEDKVEHLRAQLKQSEATLAEVREAWAAREGEVDELKTAVARERQRADQANERRAAIEDFFERKKAEFTDYIGQVTKAFADKDEAEKSLREQIEKLRGEAAARGEELHADQEELRSELEDLRAELEFTAAREEDARREVTDTRESLEHEIALRDEAIAKLKKLADELRASVSEREATIEEQMDAFAEQDKRAARLLAEKQKLERELSAKAAEASDEHDTLEEVRQALENDIADRDAAIARLKAGVVDAQKELRERAATIEALGTEAALLQEQIDKAEADRGSLERKLRAEIETIKASAQTGRQSDAQAAARDEALRRMKSLVKELRSALAERETKIETLVTDVAAAKRDALRAQEQSMQQTGPGVDPAKTARLKKALNLADRLFVDLESAHASLFDQGAGAGELLGRLRKAVSLARKAAELI